MTQQRTRPRGEKVDVTVFDVPGFWANNPQIIRTEDALVLSYAVQPMEKLRGFRLHHHYQPFAVQHWSVSTDGGFTWWTTDLAPTVGKVLDASYGVALRDGGMVVITFTWPHLTSHAVIQRGKVGQVPYISHLPAVETVPLLDLGPFRQIYFHSMTRTSDGALLACGYGGAPEEPASPLPPGSQPENRWTAFFLRSEDEGRSWRYVSHIPNRHPFAFDESGLLGMADGRVLALLRVDWHSVPREHYPEEARTGYGYFMYQTESRDNGFTWSEPVQLPLWGHPPHLLRLHSGAILLTYGHRRPPHETRAILSFDDGQTWDTRTLRVLRRFEPGNYDFGYPQATQLADGTIVCAHYGYTTEQAEGSLNPCGIFVSLFDEEWLKQGS